MKMGHHQCKQRCPVLWGLPINLFPPLQMCTTSGTGRNYKFHHRLFRAMEILRRVQQTMKSLGLPKSTTLSNPIPEQEIRKKGTAALIHVESETVQQLIVDVWHAPRVSGRNPIKSTNDLYRILPAMPIAQWLKMYRRLWPNNGAIWMASGTLHNG